MSVGNLFFCPNGLIPPHQITGGSLRNHWIGHINLFSPQRLSDLFEIQLTGYRRDRNCQMLHIAIHGNQQRFVDLVRIQT